MHDSNYSKWVLQMLCLTIVEYGVQADDDFDAQPIRSRDLAGPCARKSGFLKTEAPTLVNRVARSSKSLWDHWKIRARFWATASSDTTIM